MSYKYRSKTIRLPTWDYGSPGLYFVTINTKYSYHFFGKIRQGKMVLNEAGKVVVTEWLKTPTLRNYVELDEWIVMPNHFHGIVVINHNVQTHRNVSVHGNSFGPQKHNLASIIRGFKGSCTRIIRQGINPQFEWHSRYYEHIVRSHASLRRIRNYIRNNPANWESRY